MDSFLKFLKGKAWLIITTLFLLFVYVQVDFTNFNELVHSIIKGGLLFIFAGAFRNMFFSRTLNKYVGSGQLVKDFEGDLSKEGDEDLSKEDLEVSKFHRANQAAERLKTYRVFTVTSLVVVALLLITA
jgi:hypothetical protein